MNRALPGKRALRTEIRAKRRSLLPREQYQAGIALARNLSSVTRFNRGLLSAYVADDGEIDPFKFLSRTKGKPLRIYLPYVDFAKRMHLLHWKPGDKLMVGRWGILHPSPAKSRRLRYVKLLNVALIPVVAFDKTGNRLGRGGGFYDRLLQELNGRGRSIGLAHHFQEVEEIPTNDWDQALDEIITDRSRFVINS